jgi:ribosomal silencing factor RsfS
MSTPASRRTLFAFARLLSAQAGFYRCPRCIRLGKFPQNKVRHPTEAGVRPFTAAAVRRSDDFPTASSSPPGTTAYHGSRTGSRNTAATIGSYEGLGPQAEEIESALEMSEVEIEGLEEALPELRTADSTMETVEDESTPRYLREEGDITEEEYTEIEQLLNSQRELDTLAAHRTSQAQPEEIPEPEPEPRPDVPWYLRDQQLDTSLTQTRITIQQARQEKYPDIPYNAPPLLQPLISRLFYDHHLENILVLDLRNRDPPPVWGQNTIMILATVRAERQLRSVAEATSKWLKGTAGVIPRTDGLPKRESLVIKRRRLRRKSLRKPGYMIAPQRTTSWVSMYTGYQGLVLQLFTAEGREEYDLEGLWGDNRIIDAGALDMKPRKIRPGALEEDEPVETSRPAYALKKPAWQKKLEKEKKKWEKGKEEKASKRRWTKLEKEQARSRRGQIESGSNWEMPSIRRSSFGFQSRGDFQQRREYHSTGSCLSFSY